MSGESVVSPKRYQRQSAVCFFLCRFQVGALGHQGEMKRTGNGNLALLGERWMRRRRQRRRRRRDDIHGGMTFQDGTRHTTDTSPSYLRWLWLLVLVVLAFLVCFF